MTKDAVSRKCHIVELRYMLRIPSHRFIPWRSFFCAIHLRIGAGIGIKDILKIALAAGFWAEISASYSLPGELGAPIVGYTASATEPGNSCDRSELMLGVTHLETNKNLRIDNEKMKINGSIIQEQFSC